MNITPMEISEYSKTTYLSHTPKSAATFNVTTTLPTTALTMTQWLLTVALFLDVETKINQITVILVS